MRRLRRWIAARLHRVAFRVDPTYGYSCGPASWLAAPTLGDYLGGRRVRVRSGSMPIVVPVALRPNWES